MKKTFLNLIVFVCMLLLTTVTNGQNNLIPSTLDCSASRPPFAFEIQQKWSMPGVSNFSTPIVGDLDGDGKTEILVMGWGSSNGNSGGTGGDILIFDGASGVPVGTIATGKLAPTENTNPYVICDVDGDGKAEVFVVNTALATPTATLYTVTSNPGVRPITFGTVWSVNLPTDVRTGANMGGAIPAVADLDGDGEPEFVASYYIIETDGTVILPKMNFRGGIVSSSYMCISYVADLDADGIPEIVVGTDVYKYNGVAATLWKRCPSITAGRDGTNMAADINLDGKVDLVYHDNDHSSAGSIVVWTPSLAPDPGVSSTQGVIGSFATITGYSCYPVVGDIDGIVTNGKKYPEICYNSAGNKFIAYTFDGTSFSEKFTMTTNEASGLATFTFFDFNLDGIVELVYRDETTLHIYNAQGSMPVELYSMPASSATLIETPIVADVTGDGSADIVVTGSGNLYVFEGGSSKWASCPAVWNQQMYSPLLINRDLTVTTDVWSSSFTAIDCNNEEVRVYNGGPMQSPLMSAESFCPIDLSPDVYVISGSIVSTSTASVELTVVFGNMGMAVASASLPIQYYKNDITPANRVDSVILGVDLAPGETRKIVKSINIDPIPARFYIRIQDDGINFPAAGAYSDCNLTNNTKSFGTLELLKTANSLQSCIDGTSIFYVDLVNNTNLSGTEQTFYNVVLTDSLGTGWEYISSTAIDGTLGTFNSLTGKIQWTVPAVAPGDTAKFIMTARSTAAGAIRNSVWVETINGTVVGRELIFAYVIVNSESAPPATTITPPNPSLCFVNDVLLSSSITGFGSYQWFRNDVEISGATQSTYSATTPGIYTVTYFDGTCVSKMSDPVTIPEPDCIPPGIRVNPQIRSRFSLPLMPAAS